MYGKNDYRYYLENRLMHSDDYLAHFGVKGMKWGKHKQRLMDMLSALRREPPTVSADEQRLMKYKTAAENSKNQTKTPHGNIDRIAKQAVYQTAQKQYDAKKKAAEDAKPSNRIKRKLFGPEVKNPNHTYTDLRTGKTKTRKKSRSERELEAAGRESLAELNAQEAKKRKKK